MTDDPTTVAATVAVSLSAGSVFIEDFPAAGDGEASVSVDGDTVTIAGDTTGRRDSAHVALTLSSTDAEALADALAHAAEAAAQRS